MGQTLYLECNAGISGDMMVAAMLDLGANRQVLEKALKSIPDDSFQIEISRVKKSGVDCCDFHVILDKEHENHDHDMEYLHGKNHHDDEHNHIHEHHHAEHMHEEGHHSHDHHSHRGILDILHILEHCDMSDNARRIAEKIFNILAQAEAKAHGTTAYKVHFHEVGAIDSIVDIIAAAVCIDNLGIDKVIIPKVCEGTGTIRCQHGILSIPVPATANIMEMYNLNVEFINIQGEFVTPTGAAIAAAIMTDRGLPERFIISKIGLGAGKRTYERPSILRAMLIHESDNCGDVIYKLESNIDDCTGEMLGYTMEKLFAAGARDVHYMPVFMKKNRPGWQLNVICKKEDIEKLEAIIFKETTTIGIRRQKMERSVLQREIRTIQTRLGKAQVKVCLIDNEERFYPEYDSVAELCKVHNLSYEQVYQIVKGSCNQ